MSQSDSFIQEVTEDLRRDRLFAVLRRWGWVAILCVVVLVAGAAWNEYRKAQARAVAEALGDALLAADALTEPEARAAALAAVPPASPGAAVLVAMLRATELEAAGDREGALAALAEAEAAVAEQPLYRDLARLKALSLRAADMSAVELLAALEPLAAPGAPYRALALEQRALAQLEAGERVAAVGTLREILVIEAASQGVRARAQQLLVALGEAVPGG